MLIIGRFMVSTEAPPPTYDDTDRMICLFPTLARFDRPADTLSELLRPDGGDFVFVAFWTMLGRRPSVVEHQSATKALVSSDHNKAALVLALAKRSEVTAAIDEVAGLASYLAIEQSRRVAFIGPVLGWCLAFLVRLGLDPRRQGFSLRPVGKIRWLYRHCRKLLFGLFFRLHLPTRGKIMRALMVPHAPPPEGADLRSAEIYRNLCDILDAGKRAP